MKMFSHLVRCYRRTICFQEHHDLAVSYLHGIWQQELRTEIAETVDTDLVIFQSYTLRIIDTRSSGISTQTLEQRGKGHYDIRKISVDQIPMLRQHGNKWNL